MNCFICGESNYSIVFKKNNYDMVKCNSCGLIHAEPMPTPEEAAEFYQNNGIAQYDENYIKNMIQKPYVEGRFILYKDILLKYFENNDTILDIGANTGEFLRLLREYGFNVYGLEISGKMAKEVEKECKIPMYNTDLLELDANRRFDFISALSVIEHTPQPDNQIKKIYELLSDNGYLLIEVPNVNSIESNVNNYFFSTTLNYWFHPTPPIHLWEFDKGTICKLLQNNGFEIVEMGTANPYEFDEGTQYPEGYYIAREGLTTQQLTEEYNELLNSRDRYNENELMDKIILHVGKKLVNYAFKEAGKFSEVLDNKTSIWVLARKKASTANTALGSIDEKIQVAQKIKANIRALVEKSKLDEAKSLIMQYKNLIPSDVEAYSIEAVIEIILGDFDKAKDIIDIGLTKENNNIDLLYNLAYIYEQKQLFLEALETYERMAFSMEDNSERADIINYIRSLWEKYKIQIETQLKERIIVNEQINSNEQKASLHLMYDSQYCDRFIKVVNAHFPPGDHKFIIICKRNEKFKFLDVEDIDNVEVIDLRHDMQKLIKCIDSCSRIFIHYLFDYFCELVCKYDIKKPIYWPIWGGDLYYYIDIELYDPLTRSLLKTLGYNVDGKLDKNSIAYLYREAAIRKITYALTDLEGDYDILKDNFATNARLKKFRYPNPVDFENSKKDADILQVKRDKPILLVGNSANPTNNHMDLMAEIKKHFGNDCYVVVPLSYGGEITYINAVVAEGCKMFGQKFIPLLDYLPEDKYFSLLCEVDAGIFGHNRQQALGNIITLLYLGKRVVIKKNISTSALLNSLNIEGIYNSISDYKANASEEVNIDREKVVEYFSNEKCIEYFRYV